MFETRIRVQELDFDPGLEIQRCHQSDRGVGAVVSFLGTMRDLNAGDTVQAMALEHYPGMTEKSLAEIVQQARARWPLRDVTLIHRVGTFRPTDRIVLVAVASEHREAAFHACAFIMDYLKSDAPFWKKEVLSEGERWVQAREHDLSAKSKWG